MSRLNIIIEIKVSGLKILIYLFNYENILLD